MKVLNVVLFPVALAWVLRWKIAAVTAIVLGIRWWDRLTF